MFTGDARHELFLNSNKDHILEIRLIRLLILVTTTIGYRCIVKSLCISVNRQAWEFLFRRKDE